jgi:uncharacterized repeat protein (TIGR03803 family)
MGGIGVRIKPLLTGGTAAALLASLSIAHAGGYFIVHTFTGQNGDGAMPAASLIRDRAGYLYGTTDAGGRYFASSGVVFRIAPDGTETVLYLFCSLSNCADGSEPYGAMVRDSAGSLYGTTYAGGAHNFSGTVFKLASDGAETVLHNFCSQTACSDGYSPVAGVIRDGSGNLYGTTTIGGTYNGGVAFKLAPDGTETVLHSFCSLTNCADGHEPYGGVIRDSAGNLYGTTYIGGADNGGVVFKLAPDGTETVLHNFCSLSNCADGAYPQDSMILDRGTGNLYGTTEFGGSGGLKCDARSSCGVVFEISPNGTETVVHSFDNADGGNPLGSLFKDRAGNLYGTTFFGGKNNNGVVFKLSPDGTETVLHFFSGGSDGKYPRGGVISDNGRLFGTTLGGGDGGGVVFRLNRLQRGRDARARNRNSRALAPPTLHRPESPRG